MTIAIDAVLILFLHPRARASPAARARARALRQDIGSVFNTYIARVDSKVARSMESLEAGRGACVTDRFSLFYWPHFPGQIAKQAKQSTHQTDMN